MMQSRVTRSSTVPVALPETSEQNVCHHGIMCEKLHNLDVGNQATRDIIQFILGNTISENELIEFREVSGGDGTNQDQNMLYVSAVKAAARSLGGNVNRPIRNMLAWRIVRLDEELRKYQGGDFCPSTLARALRDPGMHPQQGGVRRARTMPNNRRLNQNEVHLNLAESFVASKEPEDDHRIELWIVVGAISLIAGGLLLYGKRPRFLQFF